MVTEKTNRINIRGSYSKFNFQLPAPADIAEARANLPRFIEYGVLNAHSLQMIYQLMENVFVPYLNTKTTAAVEGDTNQAKPQMLR